MAIIIPCDDETSFVENVPAVLESDDNSAQWQLPGVPMPVSGKSVVWVPPPVTSTDGSGNTTFDTYTIVQFGTATDFMRVRVVPGVAHTTDQVRYQNPTNHILESSNAPRFTMAAGGSQEPSVFMSTPQDKPNVEASDCQSPAEQISCVACQPDCESCAASSVAAPAVASDSAMTSTPGNANVSMADPLFGTFQPAASVSKVETTLYGRLRVKSGCGVLRSRGEHLDLAVNFTSSPDGLSAARRLAGRKRMFGWDVQMVSDGTNKVLIYWGDGTVEAWFTTDGTNYSSQRGVFGTLTRQADGSFTRITKDCVYYDFDSTPRLQTIKDRSVDGNVIYYDYNASNQHFRIRGPGLGYQAYITYETTDNQRVNLVSLESASNPAQNRFSYYDYDASGRMSKIVGPEGCVSYFEYEGTNHNLTQELNPDNYRTYFTYDSATPPRIIEINMPENQAIYFAYDYYLYDSGSGRPARTHTLRKDANGRITYYDYNAAGKPTRLSTNPTSLVYYCHDWQPEQVEGPGGPDTRCYYEWDTRGQLTTVHCCDEYTEYFTYGDCGEITSHKDALARVTYWNYDAQHLQTSWIDAKGAVVYFERDSFGKMVSRKDRRGNVTYYTYDSRGNHTSTKWADGSVRYYDFNPAGELEVMFDELGNVAYYDRDKRGRLTKWKDFLGQVSQYAYDNRSNRTIMVDRRSNAWYWQYDGLSRNVAMRTALLNTTYYVYDTSNLLTAIVDPRGNPAYFYYNGNPKQLIARENALKEITYYTYTSAGQVQSIKDPRGCTDYFTYDCHYRRNSWKDGEGHVTYYDYDKVGNRILVIDPRGNVTYTAYDSLDLVVSVKNPLVEIDYFYYDAEENRFSSEDALQRRSYFYFDGRNRQFCAEDAQVNRSYFTYEARSLRSSAKDARGNVTYFYQDKLGREFAVRDARDGVSYMEYDAESNRIASKDQRGNATYFEYDQDDRQISMKTPLGELTYYAYDTAANRTSVKDALGRLSYSYYDVLNRVFCSEDAKQARTYLTYDASGNRTSIYDPLARVTYFYFDCDQRNFAIRNAIAGLRYFTYDPSNNQDSVKDERGNVSYLYFDALNRTFAMRNAVNALTYYTFDAVGNRTSVKDPLARFNYFYFDSLNRLTASEDGLQKRTYYTYDAVANTVSIKNPRLEPSEVGVQYFTYDALNRRSSFKDEVAKVWYFDYDSASNLTSQANPLGAQTSWAYDALNRKSIQTDPLSRSWYWTYDQVGNVNSLKDGRAQVTYYQHDVVNLQHRIDYPDGPKHYFEYDLARQMTATNDPQGRTTWSYDNLGRATVRVNPGSQNLYYEYDATSNRTLFKDPDGFVTLHKFDAVNRLAEVGSNGYGTQPYGQSCYGGYVSYYEYDLADQMLHERRANLTVTYHGYDAAGRISLIQHRKSDGTLVESWAYTRDEVGNPTLMLRGSDSMRQYFNYDQANRITKEAWRTSGGSDVYGFTYEYDAAGNRNRKTNLAGAHLYWNYDLADQLVIQKAGTETRVYFEFDANGNTAVEHDVDASAGRTYYSYDPRNLLTLIDFPQSLATNYFYYNAVGERVRKDDSTGGKKYTWDGIVPVLEKNLSDSTTQRMVKGHTPIAGIGEYVLQDVGGSVIYPHKNQVGTTMRHTSGSGSVANYYEYDAWGQPLETTQATAQQFRFNSKELDADFVDFNCVNRRYHFWRRAYAPFRTAFLQVDSLAAAPGGSSLHPIYVIVHSNPARFVDPFGLQSFEQKATKDETQMFGDPNAPNKGGGIKADDAPWNAPKSIKCNNCYQYAVDDWVEGNEPGFTNDPGYYGGSAEIRRSWTCDGFRKALAQDGAIFMGMGTLEVPKECPCGMHLIYLVVNEEEQDYHFYRKDASTNTWSHKRGENAVSRVDGSGNTITNPRGIDHTGRNKKAIWIQCGFFCVRSRRRRWPDLPK